MAQPRQDGGDGPLENQQDLPFQQRQWRVQRIAWILATLVLAAGLAGLFGSGPLASAVARTADGAITVEYDRFVRSESSRRIVIRMDAARVHGRLRLTVNQDFIEGIAVERIEPVPQREVPGAGTMSYEWGDEPAGTGQRLFILHYRPREAGRAEVAIEISGAGGVAGVRFWQFAYP